MKRYLEQHVDELKKYCKDNGISFDKILSLPKCYTKTEMYIQWYDKTKTGLGLKSNQPAKVLMKITKGSNGLKIDSAPDIKQFLL